MILSFEFELLAPSGPPLNIKLNERNVSSMSFTWDAPEKINGILIGYNVCVSIPRSQTCFKMFTTLAQKILLTNLNASSKYYIRVRAHTNAGMGKYSEAVGFFTNAGKTVYMYT